MLLLKNHTNKAEMRMCFLGQTDNLTAAAKTLRAAVAWKTAWAKGPVKSSAILRGKDSTAGSAEKLERSLLRADLFLSELTKPKGSGEITCTCTFPLRKESTSRPHDDESSMYRQCEMAESFLLVNRGRKDITSTIGQKFTDDLLTLDTMIASEITLATTEVNAAT